MSGAFPKQSSSDLHHLQTCLQATLPMARLESGPLPFVPEIQLALINADFPTGPLPPDVMQAVIAEPAYWAFCWGSGQALARYLLDHPARVMGKTVVDLGSGSGIAAIAAAMAGADSVVACDTDPNALAASAANAALNNVQVATVATLPDHCDVQLMADVLYDRTNLGLLQLAQQHADEVIVADSRVTTLPDPGYRETTTMEVLTFPNLGEFDHFGTAHLFLWQRGPDYPG